MLKISKLFQLFFVLISLIFIDTVLLKRFGYNGVRPDLVLIVLVFMAHSIGPLESVISGFASGLVMDFLTLSPIGFNAIIYANLGYIFGKTKNKLFLDPILFPLLFILIAYIIKAVISFLLVVIFLPEKITLVFTNSYFLEMVLSLVLAPFMFGILKVTKLFKEHNKDRF